jgi:hypothetical protein
MEDICILKKLVSQFVDTYMGAPNTYPITEPDADNAVAHFRDLLFEGYRPEPEASQADALGFSPNDLMSEADAENAAARFRDLLFEQYRPEPENSQLDILCFPPELLVDGRLEATACRFVDIYKGMTQAEPEPLDGDETESLSSLFLKLIDDNQGNT